MVKPKAYFFPPDCPLPGVMAHTPDSAAFLRIRTEPDGPVPAGATRFMPRGPATLAANRPGRAAKAGDA